MSELADMSLQGLTPEEIEVARLAAQVYVKFKELPQAHPSDHDDLLGHVALDPAHRHDPGGDPRPPGALDLQVAVPRRASAWRASSGHSES